MSSVNDLIARYDRRALQRPKRTRPESRLKLTERDKAICVTVHELRVATREQLAEIFWPGGAIQAVNRRLLALFDAGYLDRLRPAAPPSGGSFPWCYRLGPRGHALLVDDGILDGEYRPPRITDFGYVLHDLQVTAWVLAYRRLLGERMVGWLGPPSGATLPPPELTKLPSGWRAVDLREPEPRPIRPDAVVTVVFEKRDVAVYIELDRTREPGKNYGKFDRYDCFFNSWAWGTELYAAGGRADVVFVCPDESALEAFIRGAHGRLTGHMRAYGRDPLHEGRRRTFFAVESALHSGDTTAWRFGPNPRSRVPERVALPGLELAPEINSAS